MSIHATYDDVLARAEMHTQDSNVAFVIPITSGITKRLSLHLTDATVQKKTTHPLDSIDGLDAFTRRVKKTRVRKSI